MSTSLMPVAPSSKHGLSSVRYQDCVDVLSADHTAPAPFSLLSQRFYILKSTALLGYAVVSAYLKNTN
jgi:hypothetical protein